MQKLSAFYPGYPTFWSRLVRHPCNMFYFRDVVWPSWLALCNILSLHKCSENSWGIISSHLRFHTGKWDMTSLAPIWGHHGASLQHNTHSFQGNQVKHTAVSLNEWIPCWRMEKDGYLDAALSSLTSTDHRLLGSYRQLRLIPPKMTWSQSRLMKKCSLKPSCFWFA